MGEDHSIDEYAPNMEFFAQYPETFSRFRRDMIALGDTQSNSIYAESWEEAEAAARDFGYNSGGQLFWNYGNALAAAQNGVCRNMEVSNPPRFDRPFGLRPGR